MMISKFSLLIFPGRIGPSMQRRAAYRSSLDRESSGLRYRLPSSLPTLWRCVLVESSEIGRFWNVKDCVAVAEISPKSASMVLCLLLQAKSGPKPLGELFNTAYPTHHETEKDALVVQTRYRRCSRYSPCPLHLRVRITASCNLPNW